MKYAVDRPVWETYPTLHTGLVVARGMASANHDPAAEALLAAAEAEVRQVHQDATLSQHPHIAAWRATYSSFGVTPSKYRSAVESLLRQVVKRGGLPRINRLVDLANAVSLRSVLPIAAYDLDHVAGDIVIRFARGSEPFVDLGSQEVSFPDAGEVIYSDDEGALSRRWNWRESDRTKVTAAARDVVLTAEGIGPIGREPVERATHELAALVERYCGGRVTWHLLDRDHQAAEL